MFGNNEDNINASVQSNIQMKFIYTGNLMINYAQAIEPMLKVDVHSNFIYAYTHQGYMSICKVYHSNQSIDHFNLIRLVDYRIVDIAFATHDGYTYNLAFLIQDPKTRFYKVRVRELIYENHQKGLGNIKFDLNIDYPSYRLIQLEYSLLALSVVEIYFLNLQPYYHRKVKLGHSEMIDYSMIDKHRTLLIDKDGYMFMLQQDWTNKPKELRSIDLNKIGFIAGVNALQYVNNQLVFATTPKSKLILKLSDVPNKEGNLFKIMNEIPKIGKVNDAINYNTQDSHDSKESIEKSMYNSILLSTGDYQNGEFVILSRGVGLKLFKTLINAEYITDVWVITTDKENIYLLNYYDKLRVCKQNTFNSSLVEIGSYIDFNELNNSIDMNEQRINNFHQVNDELFILFYDNLFAICSSNSNKINQNTMNDVNVKDNDININFNFKVETIYECEITKSIIVKDYIIILNSIGVIVYKYSQNTYQQYLKMIYDLDNYNLNSITIINDIVFWTSNQNRLLKFVSIDLGNEILISEVKNEIELDIAVDKTIVDMNCLESTYVRLRKTYFILLLLNDGDVYSVEIHYRNREFVHESTRFVINSKNANMMYIHGLNENKLETIIVSGERPSLIQTYKGKIDLKCLNTDHMYLLNAYYSDQYKSLITISKNLNNKCINFSKIEDNKNFHSRSVNVDFKPTFLICSKIMDCIISACESLHMDYSDFGSKFTESYIVFFKYVNLMQECKLYIGKDSLITLLNKIVVQNQIIEYVVVAYIINYNHTIECEFNSEMSIYAINQSHQSEKIFTYKTMGRIMSFLQLNNNCFLISVDNIIHIFKFDIISTKHIKVYDPHYSINEGFSIITSMQYISEDFYSIHDLLYGIKILRIDPIGCKIEVRSSCDTMLYNTCSYSITYSEHILCDNSGKLSMIAKNKNSLSDSQFYKFTHLCQYYLDEKIMRIIPISFNPNSLLEPLISSAYLLITESGWLGLFLKIEDVSVFNSFQGFQTYIYNAYYRNKGLMIGNSKYYDYKETIIDKTYGISVSDVDKKIGIANSNDKQLGFILDGDMIVKIEENSDQVLKDYIVSDKKEMGVKEYKTLLRYLNNMF